MAQWGSQDANSNSVLWAPQQFKVEANVANRNAMYGNTTANTFGMNETVGMYAVSAAEMGAMVRVASATVTNAGTGFTARPTVTFSEEEATVNATGTAVGVVVEAAIGDVEGTGYTNGDVVTVAGGTGTGATLTVDETDASGNVVTLSITTPGAYTVLPTLDENEPTGGDGSGLTVDLTIGLGPITITNNGIGYVSTPTITVGGTGGQDATAVAVMEDVGAAEDGVAHTGWVVRREGSGGRAGRVQYEVLVAGGITGDGSDDDVLPEPSS